MDLGFLTSSNDIISREIGGIPPDHEKVSGEIEPENKINDYYMKIIEDDREDTEEDSNPGSMKVLITLK